MSERKIGRMAKWLFRMLKPIAKDIVKEVTPIIKEIAIESAKQTAKAYIEKELNK